MKTIYINPQTKIKETAELLADIDGRISGFKRGDPRWEKAFNQYLLDRYQHSSTPAQGNSKRNPGPEDVIKKLAEEEKKLKEESIALADMTSTEIIWSLLPNFQKYTPVEQNIIQSAGTMITNRILINNLKMKKLDLKPRKAATEEERDKEKKRFKRAWYVAYTVETMVAALIDEALSVTMKNIDEALNKIKIKGQTINEYSLNEVKLSSLRKKYMNYVIKSVQRNFRAPRQLELEL